MNWLTITVDDLKAVVLSEIIDTAQTLITPGQADPVASAIEDAVVEVRAIVAAGNALNADPATVPRSLRALTARRAVFALLERAEIALTTDQRNTQLVDAALLARLRADRQRVEPADQPDPTGQTPTDSGGVETLARGNTGNGREDLRGI